MLNAGTSVHVVEARCEACPVATKLPALKKAAGKCPSCGADRFTVTFERTRAAMDAPTAGEIAAGAALGAVLGGGAMARAQYSESSAEFTLAGLTGAELLKRMKQPPEAVAEWLQAQSVKAARANLQANQRICPICESIFTIAFAGPTTKGYCSPMCLRQGEKRAAATPPGHVCPGCGASLKIRATSAQRKVRCPKCSTVFSV